MNNVKLIRVRNVTPVTQLSSSMWAMYRPANYAHWIGSHAHLSVAMGYKLLLPDNLSAHISLSREMVARGFMLGGNRITILPQPEPIKEIVLPVSNTKGGVQFFDDIDPIAYLWFEPISDNVSIEIEEDEE